MKKTFLKVALFSLVLGALPATTLTSCKDYDSDIDGLNQRDDALQKEINDKLAQQAEALKNQMAALQTALDEQKAEAARANAAAEAAAQAASAAQAAADNAQKAGDEAAADAAAAQAAAEAANAEALLAQAAAASAKAEAIEEAKTQVAALQTAINNQIAALESKFGDKFDEIAAMVGQAATKADLQDAINTLQAAIEASKLTKAEIEVMLAEYIANINKNTADIAALSGKVDGISESLNTLKNDLATLQSQVAANQAGVAANAAAIAAETARINKIVDESIPGLQNAIDALTQQLGDLNSDFTDHLQEYATHISAFNTFKTQVETQLNALNQFKDKYETLLAGLRTELDDFGSRLDNVETDLTKALADILKNAQAITDLNGQVTTINGELTNINGLITALQGKDTELEKAIQAIQTSLTGISNSINQINGALSTLNAINAKRLTSLTLVPTAYVGGIPTIEFYSASFTPMGALNTATGIYAAPSATAEPVLITNNDTKVFYRMNPVGVTLADIVANQVTFVQQTATSRAAETPVIKVAGVEKNDEGQLVITATKADGVTTSIDNAGKGKIYTVALKVPVAPKNYYTWIDADGNKVTEAAEDAVVYSEYCRLAESSFVPEIAHVDAESGEYIDHFTDATIWTASPAVEPVVEVPFNSEGFDLTSLVAGCMNDNDDHTLMTPEQLESFGFSFTFSVPKQEYIVDDVNQQAFASVTAEGELTPLTPATPAGLTAASRVGKTPIISVVMMRGTQVVEQKFFTVKFVIDEDATNFDIDVFTEKLSCEPLTETVDWKTFTEVVIDKLGFPMSKAEFVANYTLVEEVEGVTVDLAAADDKAPVTWNIGMDEFASMNGKDKELTKEIKFESATFPEITVNLNGVVEWPTILPTLGQTAPFYWNNGVMKILPVAMPENYNPETDETVIYKTDIFLGRMTPYLTNLLDCAEWDVQISKVTSNTEKADFDFKVGAEAPVTEGTEAYTIVNGEENAASIWYNDDDTAEAHTPFSLDAEDAEHLMNMWFFIDNNTSGIELVESESTVSLGWYIFLNGVTYDNGYNLNNTELQIIKPLKSVNAGEIKPLVQNNTVQTRNLADGMTVTDCYNESFDETNNLWKYYDITNVTWSNEVVIKDASGKVYDPKVLNMEINVSEAGVLTFTGSGIALQESYTIEVPVTITHKWGELITTVPVTVNPNSEI